MKMNGVLEVSDLYLAVYLRTKHNLKITDTRKNGNRIVFVFELGELDGGELLRSFYSGNDYVQANKFVRELRDMKTLIHNV